MVSPDRQTRRAVHIARASIGKAASVHPLGCGVVLAHGKGGAAEIACRDGSVLIETIRDGADEQPAGNVIRVGCRLASG